MGRGIKMGVVVGALVIVGACYIVCTKLSHSEISEKLMPIQIESEIEEQWKEYNPESQRFIVTLPSPPQHASQSIPFQEGEGSIRYDMYLAQSRTGVTFMINVIEYPESFNVSDSETLLKVVMKEMVGGNPGNTLVSSKRDVFFDAPSLEFLIHNQESAIKTRVIQKGHVIYVVSAADTTQSGVEKNFDRLISSFRIIGS